MALTSPVGKLVGRKHREADVFGPHVDRAFLTMTTGSHKPRLAKRWEVEVTNRTWGPICALGSQKVAEHLSPGSVTGTKSYHCSCLFGVDFCHPWAPTLTLV